MQHEREGTLCFGCMSIKQNKKCEFCGFETEKYSAPSKAIPCGVTLDKGRFILGKVLGNGGFGITYIAYDKATNEKVAIKEYFPEQYVDRVDSKMVLVSKGIHYKEIFDIGKKYFLKELKVLAKIEHENVVYVKSYFEENHTAYMVMDYCKGVTLENYVLKNRALLTEEEILRIANQIINGVEFIHSKGVIHRDIKPANIIILENNKPIIIDFGTARITTASVSGMVFYSPGYSPLEQYDTKGKNIGFWTDVYSLGAVIYFMATQKAPVEVVARKTRELTPARDINSNISNALNSIIMKSLNIEIPQRYKNTALLKMALDPISKGLFSQSDEKNLEFASLDTKIKKDSNYLNEREIILLVNKIISAIKLTQINIINIKFTDILISKKNNEVFLNINSVKNGAMFNSAEIGYIIYFTALKKDVRELTDDIEFDTNPYISKELVKVIINCLNGKYKNLEEIQESLDYNDRIEQKIILKLVNIKNNNIIKIKEINVSEKESLIIGKDSIDKGKVDFDISEIANSEAISRHHVKLFINSTDKKWYIEDLSKNGLSLKTSKGMVFELIKNHCYELQNSDEIIISDEYKIVYGKDN